MIPKIIHYCWFGGKELPESAKKCIESWKKYCPDYEIKRWDESNIDIHENRFISQAYQAKKYAFVSDYVRFKVLIEEGGIYLDTDVQLMKSLNDLLDKHAFMGFEKIGNTVSGVAPGLIIGSEPHASFLYDMVNLYNQLAYCDEQSNPIAKTVVKYLTDYLVEKGCIVEDRLQIVDDIVLYPSEYFCPKDYESGEIHLTENTYSIHHYDSTWWEPKALYLKKLSEKYGKKKGLILYRLTMLFRFDLWWRK